MSDLGYILDAGSFGVATFFALASIRRGVTAAAYVNQHREAYEKNGNLSDQFAAIAGFMVFLGLT